MPNEAHEYLQGRTTHRTTYPFNPKRYSTKPVVKENAISYLTENLADFKQTLERRNTFRKSVGIESTKVHPLAKKVKRRRNLRVFPTKIIKDHVTRSHPAERSGSDNMCTLTRQLSVVLHVREEPISSESHTTVLKRWLSSDVLTEREPRGINGVCNINISANNEGNGDECPTSPKKWRERMRKWLSKR